MCRSRRELSNEYLLPKIGVDTAENELLQVLFNIIQYYSIVSLKPPSCGSGAVVTASESRAPPPIEYLGAVSFDKLRLDGDGGSIFNQPACLLESGCFGRRKRQEHALYGENALSVFLARKRDRQRSAGKI